MEYFWKLTGGFELKQVICEDDDSSKSTCRYCLYSKSQDLGDFQSEEEVNAAMKERGLAKDKGQLWPYTKTTLQ